MVKSTVLQSIIPLVLLASPLYAQIEQITHGGRVYLAERVSGTRARLSPNQCYFDGKGLRCTGEGPSEYPGKELNGGKSFARIQGLRAGNQVSWFLFLPRAGTATLSLAGKPSQEELDKIWVEIGRIGQPASRRVQLGGEAPSLEFTEAGVYRIRVGTRGTSSVSFQGLRLNSKALEGAAILRTRWRPKAAHARLTASKLQGKVKVWIMEMDAVPGQAGFYSPMTTPFGYFCSTWTAEGRPSGMNFSLWSFGRGKKEPPIRKLSHLLAIGHPKGRFQGFGHEGTGVKPRGWNPFETWKGQRCVYALRLEPGKPYDTYYSYYFDEVVSEWRLFATGRKFSEKKRRRRNAATKETALFVGSFVEVPGPPPRQRTGHIRRTMRYRGFVLNENRECFPIDRMNGEGKKGQVCNRGRGITQDHRFELWIGGMAQLGPNEPQILETTMDPKTLPWMQQDKLQALFTVPTQIDLLGLRRDKDGLVLRYRIRGLGKPASTRLYYGPEDCLTFASRWKGSVDLPPPKEGVQEIHLRLPNLPGSEPPDARILLTNPHGRFWSMQSGRASDR